MQDLKIYTHSARNVQILNECIKQWFEELKLSEVIREPVDEVIWEQLAQFMAGVGNCVQIP